MEVLTNILSDRPAGRLHKALVETKKAASVFGFPYQLRDPGIVFLAAEVRKDQSLEAARDQLLKTMDDLVSDPPTREEVDRARLALLKNIELNLNNPEFVGLTISNWAAQGDWRLLFLHRDRLRKVTQDEVRRVSAAYLKPSNRTVALYIPVDKLPERAEIPAPPNVAAMLKDYKGDTQVAMGEAFDPSPSNIESRLRRTQLPNGLQLALLAKKTRGGVVVASMTFRYGEEKSLLGRAREAGLSAQMLLRGTRKRTRQQIRDELDKLKARANVFGSPTQVTASAETVRENLPGVLRLLAEVLREPSFPENEFEQLRQEQLAQIEQFKREPQFIVFNAMDRHLRPYPKGDPRYTSTPDEQIAEMRGMTLDRVKKFYADFYGASNAQVAVVGDFDEKEISALLTELLGSWKSPSPFRRVPSLYFAVAPASQSFETPDKANAAFGAGLNLKLRDDHPDYPALLLGNYILGSGLNSRLFRRIRQKEGLSYGVGSGLFASAQDESGGFNGFAIYAPQNAAKVEAAFKEEVSNAVTEGFTAEELKTAKAGWLQSQQVNRAQDQPLASRLSNYLFLNRTLEWDAKLESRVGALTTEQIVAALRKHLDPSKISIVKAGDFKKAAGTENR